MSLCGHFNDNKIVFANFPLSLFYTVITCDYSSVNAVEVSRGRKYEKLIKIIIQVVVNNTNAYHEICQYASRAIVGH